jgi:hypothetical protein
MVGSRYANPVIVIAKTVFEAVTPTNYTVFIARETCLRAAKHASNQISKE